MIPDTASRIVHSPWFHRFIIAIIVLAGVLALGVLLPLLMMVTISLNPNEQDIMVSSIGPFWDANETWLVLGVGILLVAFPKAQLAHIGGSTLARYLGRSPCLAMAWIRAKGM